MTIRIHGLRFLLIALSVALLCSLAHSNPRILLIQAGCLLQQTQSFGPTSRLLRSTQPLLTRFLSTPPSRKAFDQSLLLVAPGSTAKALRETALGYNRRAAGARFGLGEEEITSIYLYTTFIHKKVNEALRAEGTTEVAEKVKPFAQAATLGLGKLPPHEGWVRRGVNLPPEELEKYQVGHEVTENGFTSATLAKTIGREKPHQFVILSKKGRDISEFSHFEGEKEVLFAPGSRFRVVKKEAVQEEGRSFLRISMEEVVEAEVR